MIERTLGRRVLPAVLLVVMTACGGESNPAARFAGSRALKGLLRQEGPVQLATGDTMTMTDGTRQFYAQHKHRFAWVKAGDLTKEGEAVYAVLANSDEDGLSPQQYGLAAATALRKRLVAARESDVDSLKRQRPQLSAQLDAVLSEGMARYASHLAQGAIDPKDADLDWRIPREAAPEEDVLTALATGRAPAEVVAALRPKSLHYQRFVEAFARYRDLEQRGVKWPEVPEGKISEGQRSPAVALLRQRLAASPDAREAQLAAAGQQQPDLYDAQLKQALQRFQERHSIEPDGALGPATREELNRTLAERMEEMRLNMDRWRWLPHEMGERYVLVNIAGFEMEVVEKGKTIEAMNVVVGAQQHHTPVFADTMENVVVNPYWNVPNSIIEEEIGPALASDPGYLERNNMERTSAGGIRQRPGDDNALGKFKFIFPNDDDIYLHDTPAKSLFRRVRRDFSHGCIRLERPRDLANLIVSKASSKSPADIDAMLATGSERWIKLDQKLPVYILYFTAWVKEDGTVQFHHDVYGRDEQLEAEAQKKLT